MKWNVRIVGLTDDLILGDDTVEDLFEEVERMKGPFVGSEPGDKRVGFKARDGSADLRRVVFECNVCHETDTAKLYANEPTPAAISCAACHAGVGTSPEQMLHTGRGMFPRRPTVSDLTH